MNRQTLWGVLRMSLPALAALIVILSLTVGFPAVPVRTGGVICGVVTLGLVGLLRYMVRERGLAISAGVVGAIVAFLFLFLHPVTALAMTLNVLLIVVALGFFSYNSLKEGQMYPFLCLTWWLHTRVNRLDEEVLDKFPNVAQRGHFGLDFVFTFLYRWPFRVIPWPARLVTVDVGRVIVKTKPPQEVYLSANPAIAFRWSPDLRRAINILSGAKVKIGDKEVDVDEGNADESLTAYLEPWILGALRNVIATKYTFGTPPVVSPGLPLPKDTDVNAKVNDVRNDVLTHLASEESPFAQLGLLKLGENGEWQVGPSARTFELEIPELLPIEGSDLAKAVGAQAVAERKREARAIEGRGEAAYATSVGTAQAKVEGLKTQKVGEAAARVAKRRIDAETEGIDGQMKKLSRKRGLTSTAVLDELTTRSAAQSGATMIMIPGLAGAAEAVAKALAGQKEEKKEK